NARVRAARPARSGRLRIEREDGRAERVFDRAPIALGRPARERGAVVGEPKEDAVHRAHASVFAFASVIPALPASSGIRGSSSSGGLLAPVTSEGAEAHARAAQTLERQS